MKNRCFNVGPLSVTLTLTEVTLLLRSAHHLIIVITCAKLFQQLFSGLSYQTDKKCRLSNI
jgi:hypothetical protein